MIHDQWLYPDEEEGRFALADGLAREYSLGDYSTPLVADQNRQRYFCYTVLMGFPLESRPFPPRMTERDYISTLAT